MQLVLSSISVVSLKYWIELYKSEPESFLYRIEAGVEKINRMVFVAYDNLKKDFH